MAVIEKYTKSTRFCLICNYASKIIPALQSRCTRFRFAPLDPANVTERLRYVIQQEGYVHTRTFSLKAISKFVDFVMGFNA